LACSLMSICLSACLSICLRHAVSRLQLHANAKDMCDAKDLCDAKHLCIVSFVSCKQHVSCLGLACLRDAHWLSGYHCWRIIKLQVHSRCSLIRCSLGHMSESHLGHMTWTSIERYRDMACQFDTLGISYRYPFHASNVSMSMHHR